MDLKQSGDTPELNEKGDMNYGASQQSPDGYFCSRCEQKMPSDEKEGHEDWHFAVDLQAEEQGGPTASEPPVPAMSKQQELKSQPTGDDQFFCSRCEKSLPSNEKGGHEDWHLALNLQAQEQAGAGASERPAGDQPPGYAPLSYSQSAYSTTRAMTSHHHTNQVIEAARVRARDEVRFPFGLALLYRIR
jgi:Ubiquitin-Binding Zinc Finger